MQSSPHTDRLMSELRSKIESISSEAANSVEQCVAFRNNEAVYEEWLKRHAKNGFVLHRDNAKVTTAYLHAATCREIGGEPGVRYTKTSKVGCPTKSVALAFAAKKQWKVMTTCDQCVIPE